MANILNLIEEYLSHGMDVFCSLLETSSLHDSSQGLCYGQEPKEDASPEVASSRMIREVRAESLVNQAKMNRAIVCSSCLWSNSAIPILVALNTVFEGGDVVAVEVKL